VDILRIFSKYSIKKYNFFLIMLSVAISVMGILLIGSAKADLVGKQTQGLIIGVVFMLIISLIDYHFVLKFYWLEYALAIALLVAVYFFGDKGGGAARWFVLFGIRFQPSELVKILLILFYAQFIMKHKDTLNTFRIIITCVLLIIPPFVLIFEQPDLSTSIMILVIFAVVMFLGGLSYKVILVTAAIAIPAAVILLNMILTPGQTIVNEYQQKRILAWIQPEKYASTEAYQQLNSITAIGSGQLHGKGLNNNIIGSVKNGNFISEAQTDFIFAIAGEELGFVGSCAIIILLFLIAMQCIWIAVRADDLAGRLIAGGMAGFIGFQTFINIGVTTMILPNTGLTLPFVSYGLTSLVALYAGMGFVLNVSIQAKKVYL
jgi:rod shape determining protein RodA